MIYEIVKIIRQIYFICSIFCTNNWVEFVATNGMSGMPSSYVVISKSEDFLNELALEDDALD